MIKTSIFSLTEKGQKLSETLVKIIPNSTRHHKTKPFGKSVQAAFQRGERLILICAMGIAVRTLAPVLNSKLTDPAVIIMDDAGKFVIPMLSGHEGGANAWADDLSQALNAQCITTGVQSYRKPIYVAGMGCERDCPVDVLTDLLQECLTHNNFQIDLVSAIASIDIKHNELGLIQLSDKLDVPFVVYDATTLRQVEDQLSIKSDIVFREVGCYGVAEAAALIHAQHLSGNKAELVINKQKNCKATFALARSFIETDTLSIANVHSFQG